MRISGTNSEDSASARARAASAVRARRRRLGHGRARCGTAVGVAGDGVVGDASASGSARDSSSVDLEHVDDDHVMLSSPPAAFAASTRRSAARCGSGSLRTMRSMSRSRTMSVSPSEQITTRSPAMTSIVYRSTSTSASTPSARVTIARCGCDSACSAREAALADELLDEAVVVGDASRARRRAAGTRASRRRGR